MSRKQLALLVVILLVLGGAAAWIYSGGNKAWKQADTQAGTRLVPGLVPSNVASIRINGGKEVVTLERKGTAWGVKERDGYTADTQKIAALLGKLADLKVTQTETISEGLRPRLKLAAPGQADGGIAIDLLDAAGKDMGSLIAGKTIDRKSDIPGATKEIPTGRYVLKRDQETTAIAINDPLNEVDTSPRAWVDKTFIKPDRIKTLTLVSSGKPRFVLARSEEAAMAWSLKDAAKGEDLDTTKAQDEAGALGGLAMVDLVPGPNPAELGLTDGSVLTAETFDGLTYTLTFGKKDGENRAVSVGVSGKSDAPRERVAGKDEKPEDKAKLDKEFKDKLAALDERLAREQAMDKKVFLVTDASAQFLLKDRAALMKQKQTVAQPDVPGLQNFEAKKAPAKAPAKK